VVGSTKQFGVEVLWPAGWPRPEPHRSWRRAGASDAMPGSMRGHGPTVNERRGRERAPQAQSEPEPRPPPSPSVLVLQQDRARAASGAACRSRSRASPEDYSNLTTRSGDGERDDSGCARRACMMMIRQAARPVRKRGASVLA
jgi:hypothetical protein